MIYCSMILDSNSCFGLKISKFFSFNKAINLNSKYVCTSLFRCWKPPRKLVPPLCVWGLKPRFWNFWNLGRLEKFCLCIGIGICGIWGLKNGRSWKPKPVWIGATFRTNPCVAKDGVLLKFSVEVFKDYCENLNAPKDCGGSSPRVILECFYIWYY